MTIKVIAYGNHSEPFQGFPYEKARALEKHLEGHGISHPHISFTDMSHIDICFSINDFNETIESLRSRVQAIVDSFCNESWIPFYIPR